MKPIAVSHPHISAQWHPTKNKELTPYNISAWSKKKIWWLCPNTCKEGCLHEWQSVVRSRCAADGCGCPFCSKNLIILCEHTSIVCTHPSIAAQWHPTKNTNLTPYNISAGMIKKVWWLCPNTCNQGCLHEWQAVVRNRCSAGYGCPFCSKIKKEVCIHTSIVGTHPSIAAQWHPTKNGNKKPEQYSYGSEKKIWWLCPNTCPEGCLHEWEAELSKRVLRGIHAGCPYCARTHKKTCIHTSIVGTHPDIVTQWHPEKNGTLLPEDVTHGSSKKVWWLCPNTCTYGCKHEWEARISDRTTATIGCPQCCNFLQKLCIHQSIAYTHTYLVKEWHPDKNGELQPGQFSHGSEKKIWWRCTLNSSHIWITSIHNRCSGATCPRCTNKTEILLFNYLSERYSNIVRRFTIDSCKRIHMLPFDMCLIDKKIIIELDGPQHFRQISNWLNWKTTMHRDVYKIQQAEKEGYKVIHISQEDVSKATPEWLEENLITYINSDDRDHIYISMNEDLYNKHIELYTLGNTIKIIDL